MLEMIKAIIYGIVEGITEWLPISSTGHLILVERLIPFKQTSEGFFDMFDVVIQLGAILAVVVLFWNKIWPFYLKKNKQPKKGGIVKSAKDPAVGNVALSMDAFWMWVKIVVACIPAVVYGLLFDDAVGEAFQKEIGLGYPGGPKIDRIAKEGNPDAIQFPKAHMDSEYDFSFSGLKSSVLNYLNKCEMKGEEVNRADIAASFQEAVVDVLSSHGVEAAKELGYRKLAIAGGVASNGAFRTKMIERCKEAGIEFYHPSPIFCTDNAAMIGVCGYYDYINGVRSGLDLNAVPGLKIGTRQG